MATLRIDRKEWRRGGNRMDLCEMFDDTNLLSANHMKCCLGFAMIASGAEFSSVLNKGEPKDIKGGLDSLSNGDMFGLLQGGIEADVEDEDGNYCLMETELVNSPLTDAAIDINDNKNITEEERESRLTELFKKYGHTVEFYGETDPAYLAYLEKIKEQ